MTLAALSGVVSIILLFTGLWLPSNQYKDAVFILAGLSVLWAAYSVWVDERNRMLSLSEEHRQLQQRASESSDALEEGRRVTATHVASIDALQRVVARLSARPFDEGQRAHAKSLIALLNYMQRDLLRFLLLRGAPRMVVKHSGSRVQPRCMVDCVGVYWRGAAKVGIMCCRVILHSGRQRNNWCGITRTSTGREPEHDGNNRR